VLTLGRSYSPEGSPEGPDRRRRLPGRVRLAGAVLALLHLTAVWWLTLRSVSGVWMPAGSTMPLHTIRGYLALGPAAAAVHLGGGLLLLSPLGVLLPAIGGRLVVPPLGSFARTAFGGLMLAFVTEVLRTGVAGLVFDVDAVLLNATGVALAYLLVVPAARAALRRRGYGRPPADPFPDAFAGTVDGDPLAAAPRPPIGVAP